MVTTRSSNPRSQTKIEDFSNGKKRPSSADAKSKGKSKSTEVSGQKATSAPKRKAPSGSKGEGKTNAAKKQKVQDAPSKSSSGGGAIIINRAPVLHLWAASVAHLVHPELSWQSCLSAGSAIASITAIAKGRSIGAIAPAEDTEKKQEKRRNQPAEDDVVEVMQFKLRFKDGLALVGSDKKGKPGSDAALKSKFGDAAYERVRLAFEQALEPWKGYEDELSELAFGFYEDFRPSVKPGQGGWGRKGELNLDSVKSAASRD